ncbi:hypothetical protein [Bifidobacterium sp. SO1]|uniref:hypothetical protein n=1 Tax=Bifidobacterium sp. SO1 TaxID=2809029 RepID=UPI001BDBFF86|nr:hypothetical protein [Bifidobacterium sp. SO1]MBT1162184.1 hypothetical protein [Bifidobacterium sp. SO1]
MTADIQIGQLIRLYLRADQNQWAEFFVQEINEHHEPIDPDGDSYPAGSWAQYRSTGFKETPDEYVTLHNKRFKHWRCRINSNRLHEIRLDEWEPEQ